MSLAYLASRQPAHIISRGSKTAVALTWLGIGLGFVAFASTVAASPQLEHRMLYAATLPPTPQEITAYTAAICGAVVTILNTALMVWHKLNEPRRPRRPRKPKVEPKKPEAGK